MSQNQRIFDKLDEWDASCDIVVRVSGIYSVVIYMIDDRRRQRIEAHKVGHHIVFLK